MAASVTHAKVSDEPDGSNPDDILISDWNADHVVDVVAADVPVTPVGAVAATDVQAAIQELDSEKSASGHNHDAAYDAIGDAAAAVSTHAGLSDPHTGYVQEGLLDRCASFSQAGTLAITDGPHRWYNDTGRTLTFTAIRGAVGTAPTGADIIVDVNVNGTTIMTSTKVVIAATTNTIKQTTFSTTTIADGSYLEVDIDQVGSSVPGSNLTVSIWMKG